MSYHIRRLSRRVIRSVCYNKSLPYLTTLRPVNIYNSSRRFLICKTAEQKTVIHTSSSSSVIIPFGAAYCRKTMCASASFTSPGSYQGYRNRLGLERSPYLLQHANNPVDWYAWGSDAFEKARAENKIIFLSVGYSTCHWCHVMERESFENEEVGRILNENFVSIKVDREERPDVDHIYMTFIQATSGGGGWPMNVWLTPDLKPIVGGTYFPPDDRYFGRPGFKSILGKIATAWREKPNDVLAQSGAILDALSRAALKAEGSASSPLPDVTLAVNECFAALSGSYDKTMGGFTHSPKFPQPVNLNFMLHLYEKCCREAHASRSELSERGQRALEMTLHTLRMMARGGMHDHIGQGFHRYSTDEEWHVPHFEKMLYDQAQLAVIYLDVFQSELWNTNHKTEDECVAHCSAHFNLSIRDIGITKEQLFADVARDILSYVNRDLSDKCGGFYSAEDADSYPSVESTDKREGAFCVWTYEEIQDLLFRVAEDSPGDIKLADVFCFHYDVRREGNVHMYKDPHGELTKQNILIERGDLETTSKHFGLTVQQTENILDISRKLLWQRRLQRPRPHLDNKMITAWNGMMISAFAKAGQVLDDASYIRRAVDAIKFINSHLYDNTDELELLRSHAGGRLLRSCYVDSKSGNIVKSSPTIYGFAEDYTFIVRAALDVYEATHDECWLQWATRLQRKQDLLFWDSVNFGYFTTTLDDSSIIIRLKEDQDGAEPSYNSVSAHNLLRLCSIMDCPSYRKQAEQIFISFGKRLESLPIAVPELLTALMIYAAPSLQICICGNPSSGETSSMLKCINSHYLPRKTVLVLDSRCGRADDTSDIGFLRSQRRSLDTFKDLDGKTTAYVCDNLTCSLPVTSVVELNALLSYSRVNS